MDGQLFQTLVAGGIVLGATGFLGRRWIGVLTAGRGRKDGGGAGCAGGCGCSSKH